MEESRRAARIPVLVRVECKTPQNYILGNCQNISETGMWIKTRQPFDVSQEVTLRFALPPVSTGKVIQAQGVIVRVQEGEYMAVKFTRLRRDFRTAIIRFVERAMGADTMPGIE